MRSRRPGRPRPGPAHASAPRRPPKPGAPPPAKRPPRPTDAETRLLDLARKIAALPVADAVRALADAYAPDAPLPGAVAQAWLRSRGDKTATLALAFARENLRLALEEVLARAPRGMLPGTAETRAWLVLAACEAIAHEPREAAADRRRALLELTGHPGEA